MSLTASWLDVTDRTSALTATIEFSKHGLRRQAAPLDVIREPFEDTDPVRSFASYRQKRNFEGKLWLASTGRHVPFESFWERAFLAMVDRAGDVTGVGSQPMLIRWRSPKESHVPDYFVRHHDGTGLLVDVRPEHLIEPVDAAKFERTRRLAAALGWSYLVFKDLPGAMEFNLRFLMRYRDPAWLEGVDPESLRFTGAMTLDVLRRRLSGMARSELGAAYALIWRGIAEADLGRPLSSSTIVRFTSRV